MDTFKPEEPQEVNEHRFKPIGRQLLHEKEMPKSGVALSTVAFIVILTAIFAFVAGTRADDYISIGNILNGSSSSVNAELPDDIDYSTVEEVYDSLVRQYDGALSIDSILDGLKKGLAESTGDPYTTYLNQDQAQEFTNELNGTFSGIGAEIGKQGELIIIVSPLDGFPAKEAGIKAKDIVLEIDGEDATGMSIDEAVLTIRGEAGTDVVLSILREGEQLDITVTRSTITIPSVTESIEGRIGIIRIARFAEDTERLVDAAADKFLSEGVDGVVLDMRGNSGGFLNSAVKVSGIWLDSLLVLEQREDDGMKVTQEFTANVGAKLGGLPTVVLVDGGTASASEIVAGALQDHDIATIMGEASFGKGSVQNLEELPDGGVLKVTVARWYTPSGNNIDKEGIEPDVIIEFEESDDEDSDNQLDAAVKYIKDQL